MKKIIHLSDLHVGYKDLSTVFSGMIDRLIYLYDNSEHIIVITGDTIDDITKEGQLEMALAEIARLRNDDFTVLVAPGNHDYGKGGGGATKAEMRKFKAAMYGNPEEPFPKFDKVDNIAFIALDSMQGEIEKGTGLSGADGKIGKTQRNALDDMLSNNPKVAACDYKVVYLHHHPIDTGKLFKKWTHGLGDASKLRKIIEKHNIDALLFGHNHDGKHWCPSWGVKRAYDAGSSTGKNGSQGKHRVIDLSLPDISTDYDAEL